MFSFVQLQSIPIKEMCRNQCLKTPVSLSPFLLKSLNLIYGENPIKVLFLVSLLGKKMLLLVLSTTEEWISRSYHSIWTWDFVTQLNWKENEKAEDTVAAPGRCIIFCRPSFAFWREMGLGIQSSLESQNCMWSSSALLFVSCVQEWKENKQTNKQKRSNREGEKRETLNQTPAERKT